MKISNIISVVLDKKLIEAGYIKFSFSYNFKIVKINV